jgi:hypothetical protein
MTTEAKILDLVDTLGFITLTVDQIRDCPQLGVGWNRGGDEEYCIIANSNQLTLLETDIQLKDTEDLYGVEIHNGKTIKGKDIPQYIPMENRHHFTNVDIELNDLYQLSDQLQWMVSNLAIHFDGNWSKHTINNKEYFFYTITH